MPKLMPFPNGLVAEKEEGLEPRYWVKNMLKPYYMKNGMFYQARKMPDRLRMHVANKDGSIKIPMGLSSFVDVTPEGWEPIDPSNALPEPAIKMYPEQEEVVSDLISKPSGVLFASTGSGKSIMACHIAYRLGCRAVIVLSNMTLLEQMKSDVQDVFGFIPRTVCGKKQPKYENADPRITLLSVDSCDKLPEFAPGEPWTLILDEADKYVVADRRREWLLSVCPRYQYALTGTISLNRFESRAIPMLYGRVVDFTKYNYRPEFKLVNVPFHSESYGMKEFHELKKSLYSDEKRNGIIADTVASTLEGGKGIVFCEYVEHAETLTRMLEERGVKSFKLIGEVSMDERESIRSQSESLPGPLAVVGSVQVVGRGFNVPSLDRGYLACQQSFRANSVQYVGRILRKSPGKRQPVFYDFREPFHPLLAAQAAMRKRTYMREYSRPRMETDNSHVS